MAKRKVPTDIPMEKITDPDQYGFYGISLDPEQRVFRDAIWNPNIDVVICNAAAGSGKTLIATATANLLVQAGYFDKLTYVVSSYGRSVRVISLVLSRKNRKFSLNPFIRL